MSDLVMYVAFAAWCGINVGFVLGYYASSSWWRKQWSRP